MLKRVASVFALLALLVALFAFSSPATASAHVLQSSKASHPAAAQGCLGSANNVTLYYLGGGESPPYHCTGTYSVYKYVATLTSDSWSGYWSDGTITYTFCNNSFYNDFNGYVTTITLSPTRIC